MQRLSGLKDEQPATVLLVEDGLADQRLVQRAFRRAKLLCHLQIVGDGQEALDYLCRKGDFADGESYPLPQMILLDLNMPKLGGLELLRQLKASEELAVIPVVVMTSSDHEQDLIQSYALGCSSFIKKPVEIHDFMSVVSAFGEYWFNIVTFPH